VPRHSSSCGNAELFFHVLDQCGQVQYGTLQRLRPRISVLDRAIVILLIKLNNELSSLLLGREQPRDRGQSLRHFVEVRNELGNCACIVPINLASSSVAARPRCQCLDAIGIHDMIRHRTGFDHQLVVSLCISRSAPWLRTPGRRTYEHQAVQPSAQPNRENGCHQQHDVPAVFFRTPQVNTGFSGLGAQCSHATYRQTTILGDDDRLRLRDLLADLGYYRFFSLQDKTQGPYSFPLIEPPVSNGLKTGTYPRRPFIRSTSCSGNAICVGWKRSAVSFAAASTHPD